MEILTIHQRELATQCLIDFQKNSPEADGLIFSTIGGMLIASTFPQIENTDRLAAASAAMYLLSEQAFAAWGKGDAAELMMKLPFKDSDDYPPFVNIQRVGDKGLFLNFFLWTERYFTRISDTKRAIKYLADLFEGIENPPIKWR